MRKLAKNQTINHFPGSFYIGKKNCLFDRLNKLQKIYPSEYDFFPLTYLLPTQYEQLRGVNTAIGKQKVYIVKPEASCQGKGIFLTQDVAKDLESTARYVVQEYIHNPLLIENLKFDLRVYVLLRSVSPLKIFIYKEGLARFATEKYEKPGKRNLKSKWMHLTNYAVNKKNPIFQPPSEFESKDDTGHKRSISSILKVSFFYIFIINFLL